jgi:hypothetical protein
MFTFDTDLAQINSVHNTSLDLTGAGIFKQLLEARNQVGIGLWFRPARLHSLAELASWNRFLGFLKV